VQAARPARTGGRRGRTRTTRSRTTSRGRERRRYPDLNRVRRRNSPPGAEPSLCTVRPRIRAPAQGRAALPPISGRCSVAPTSLQRGGSMTCLDASPRESSRPPRSSCSRRPRPTRSSAAPPTSTTSSRTSAFSSSKSARAGSTSARGRSSRPEPSSPPLTAPTSSDRAGAWSRRLRLARTRAHARRRTVPHPLALVLTLGPQTTRWSWLRWLLPRMNRRARVFAGCACKPLSRGGPPSFAGNR
jgi:hypothetical protein